MEFIRIPQVSLVDASGKRIGVYTDDPDWWQQLKLKQHQQNKNQKDMMNLKNDMLDDNEKDEKKKKNLDFLKDYIIKKSLTSLSHDNLPFSSTLQLKVLAAQSGVDGLVPKNFDENHKKCNVIGETPLHIAIIYEDLEVIRFLVEAKGYSVNQRTVCSKFQPGFNSKMTSSFISNSQYECLAYFGEYPLAFAASFCNKEIYDYLISKGADPNMQDSYGNTVLHILVINNKLDMFKYAIIHPVKRADLTIKNSQNLTPLNLAAKLGREKLFTEMLELRSAEYWRYHNITCSAYPLDGLDTIGEDGKIAWNAALQFIINGNTDDHLEMIEGGVVKRLLEDKWNTYGQRRFFQRLVIATIHLIFLSIAVYCRKSDKDNLAIWPPVEAVTWVRYISEVAVVLGCMSTIFLQIQEIYAQGFLYYLRNLQAEPAKVFYQLSCVLILFAVPFRFIAAFDPNLSNTARQIEDSLLIIAIPCSWVFLLFFARVANVTGPFVVMIYKMIVGDILTFSYIYIIVLFGFSLSFYYLFKNSAHGIESFDRFENAIVISFQMTLGEFKDRVEEFNQVQHSDFTKVIFVAFMIMVHILLLNMLIAMMGNTYQQIIRKSEREWRRQWAQIVILLEQTFTAKELKKYQAEYSIKLPKQNENAADQLGLMVIKKTAKTKAFQKNNAIKNWKRFGKMVLQGIKEHKFFATIPVSGESGASLNWHKLVAKNADQNPVPESNLKKAVEAALNGHNKPAEPIAVVTTTNSPPPAFSAVVQSKVLIHSYLRNMSHPSHHKSSPFTPNQTNKIYPMFTNSVTNIDLIAESTPRQQSSESSSSQAKVKLPFVLKNDALAYIKRETYPKFSYIKKSISQSFESSNNSSGNNKKLGHKIDSAGSGNSSNSELIKDKSSFGDESPDIHTQPQPEGSKQS